MATPITREEMGEISRAYTRLKQLDKLRQELNRIENSRSELFRLLQITKDQVRNAESIVNDDYRYIYQEFNIED